MLGKLMNRIRRAFRRDEGFTLMELMVVVTIIAILAGGGLVGYNAFIDRAVNGVASATAGALQTAVRMYEMDNGTSLGDLALGNVDSELTPYVSGDLIAQNASGAAPNADDATAETVWVRCPDAGGASPLEWTVWVWRNGRIGTATFTGQVAPDTGAAGSCSNS